MLTVYEWNRDIQKELEGCKTTADYDKWFQRRFVNNGLDVLHEASSVKVFREVNGDYRLTFQHPIDSEKMSAIQKNNLIQCEGQLFRINRISKTDDGTHMCEVNAMHVWFDCQFEHIQYLQNYIGRQPYEVAQAAFANSKIKLLAPAEIQALGMEWVTSTNDRGAIDFFKQSKTTPAHILEEIISCTGKGEIYIDNWKTAIVEQLPKGNSVWLDMTKNCKQIKRDLESTSMITRLYPYGKNGLHIGSQNNGVQYIDSPNVAKYGVLEGSIDYNNISTASELLQRAQWEFDPDNAERIDIPTETITIEVIDLSKLSEYGEAEQIRAGDTVYISNDPIGVEETAQRVKSIEYYPYEPENSTVTLGRPIKNLFYYVKQNTNTTAEYNKVTNASHEVKTSWLEMMQNNETTAINNDLEKYPVAKYDYGAIWTDEDKPCAVAIINGRLAISNQKRDGDWYWTAVMDAGKVIVNEVFTGELYTSGVSILGDKKGNEKLSIKGNLIEIKDENANVRVKIGYTNGKYVFEMYGRDGTKKTLHINDNGDAVFSGTIDTEEDVKVGENLVLRQKNNGAQYGKIYAGTSQVWAGEKVLQIEAPNVDIFAKTDVLRLRGLKRVSIGTADGKNNVYINDERAATENYVDDAVKNLQNQINALKGGGE